MDIQQSPEGGEIELDFESRIQRIEASLEGLDHDQKLAILTHIIDQIHDSDSEVEHGDLHPPETEQELNYVTMEGSKIISVNGYDLDGAKIALTIGANKITVAGRLFESEQEDIATYECRGDQWSYVTRDVEVNQICVNNRHLCYGLIDLLPPSDLEEGREYNCDSISQLNLRRTRRTETNQTNRNEDKLESAVYLSKGYATFFIPCAFPNENIATSNRPMAQIFPISIPVTYLDGVDIALLFKELKESLFKDKSTFDLDKGSDNLYVISGLDENLPVLATSGPKIRKGEQHKNIRVTRYSL